MLLVIPAMQDNYLVPVDNWHWLCQAEGGNSLSACLLGHSQTDRAGHGKFPQPRRVDKSALSSPIYFLSITKCESNLSN